MKKRGILYLIITLIFLFLSFYILSKTDLKDNVLLSKSIQIIIILFFIRVSIGCTFYIRNQYEMKKYSYDIIMNLGLLLFINVNILRMMNLLVQNWNVLKIEDIYLNTLHSFSYFAMLTLPCIVILAFYSILTNLVLVKKEGFSPRRLLGIILGIFAFLGLFGSQAIYYLFVKLLMGTDIQFIKYTLDICVNTTLSYFYTLMIATLYCNWMAARHIPSYDQDYIIILGSKVNSDGTLTPLLKGRADKAIAFGKEQYDLTKKKIVYVPSGGKGEDESIAEAKAIESYLVEQGIPKKQILIEDQSTSTIENMRFSKQKIDSEKKNAHISFSTTNYHVFRSGVIANQEGMNCEGMGSKTKWYFYTNALIREFIANMMQERWKHISLLCLIYLTMFVLIWIGYYYHFLVIV